MTTTSVYLEDTKVNRNILNMFLLLKLRNCIFDIPRPIGLGPGPGLTGTVNGIQMYILLRFLMRDNSQQLLFF